MEFQSTVDPTMALRFLRYLCEFYQFFIQGKRFNSLPPILPLLIYNGPRSWTPALDFADLVETGIDHSFIPSFRYLPIIVNRFSPQELSGIRNAVSAVFLLENLGMEKLKDQLTDLADLIRGENRDVIELYIHWLNDYIGNTGDYDDGIEEILSLKEVDTMFAASLKRYEKKLIQQGREETLSRNIESMKSRGLSQQEIAHLLDLAVERVEQILKAGEQLPFS